jgi:hypothetical protein
MALEDSFNGWLHIFGLYWQGWLNDHYKINPTTNAPQLDLYLLEGFRVMARLVGFSK